MTEKATKPSVPSKPSREERLAEALRANLKKRKTQARERAKGVDTQDKD